MFLLDYIIEYFLSIHEYVLAQCNNVVTGLSHMIKIECFYTYILVLSSCLISITLSLMLQSDLISYYYRVIYLGTTISKSC